MSNSNIENSLGMIQDVIDRILYLDVESKNSFSSDINELLNKYPINYEIVDGVRIYNQTQYERETNIIRNIYRMYNILEYSNF